MSKPLLALGIAASVTACVGCVRTAGDQEASGKKVEKYSEEHTTSTNRIAVPQSVRSNLGITFARVEYRPVAQTIRIPGRFDYVPEARREYRTMLDGRVEILVRQFDAVKPGMPMYRLSSPQWRELQEKLSDAESTIKQTEARVASIPLLIAAHRRHEEILEESISLWEERVAQLQASQGSGVVTANEVTNVQATLAEQRAELAEILEKEADLEGQIVAAQAEHDAAHGRFRLLIATASTLLGMDENELASPYKLGEHLHTGIHRHEDPVERRQARWEQINEVTVSATGEGIIESLALTNGAWATGGALVVTVVDPRRLRFHAMAMQSDLGSLSEGLPAKIVPPRGGSLESQKSMEAILTIGMIADPQGRTVELVAVPKEPAPWARAGIAAHLEVVTAGGQEELAVPLSCVIQDGLTKVFFRRDPNNPDQVIRMEADLGIDDGRWVVVESGVREGDEVVGDGVYQLMVATSGTIQKGGHFHADGTFHSEEDE